MFRNKVEVDEHVRKETKKINNETERNLRCFNFAKLYLHVGDYEHAARYINSYLSVKPKSAEGHIILGRALENLGKTQKAIEAYRTSLQLDPKQNNLVLKICELMSKDDIYDSTGAKYFCDLAHTIDPQNPSVTDLKEKLIMNNSKDPNDVTKFLIKELEYRPTDVNLRVRLLKHLLEHNMIKEAYKHAFSIEQKKFNLFDDSIAWYETFAEVLVKYQRDATISTQLTWEFWFLSTSVLEKLAELSLNDHIESVKSTTDCITAVFNFDQALLKASQSVELCPDKILLKEFLKHYEAQIYLHFAVLALKQAKKDLMTFKEVQNIILPLLFIAYNTSIPDIQSVWFNSLPEARRLLVSGWHVQASFRCSQAGNILLGLAKDRRNILLEKGNQYSTGMWREQLFKKLFVKRDQQLKSTTSFFMSSTLEPTIKLPDYRDLITHNEISQMVNPSSLHHYIWLASNYQNLADFHLKTFDALPYSVKNINNCAAENLSLLDLQSYIYAATLCARAKKKNLDTSLTYFNQDKPPVLPVSITGNLGTLNQSKFVHSAYMVTKEEHCKNAGEIRLIIIKGLEVIRCTGSHGLDAELLIMLASTFAERSINLTKQSEIEANAARAELFYKTALSLLEKMKNDHAVVYPKNRVFEYNRDLSKEEINGYIEKAKLFIGTQLMKKKEYEKAMHVFEGLKDPYASFYQSQIFKHMADAKTNHSKENVTSEMRSQNIILLSRARDCLYLTLDRLKDPCQDRNHPLNAQLGTEIEKTERLLSRIDPDCTNRNDCDGISEENASDESVGDQYLSTYTHNYSFQNGRDYAGKNDTLHLHSTPLRIGGISRQEARPSPERLDAQLRQLMASKDVAMNSILEQHKMMVELQKSLTDEIRGFKDAVNNLTSVADQRAKVYSGTIEDVKKMVDDMSHSVDDRLQSVTDMVLEMRKELNEIKKDQNKNAQLSVEDLYDLDPDYNAAIDYNLGPNLTSSQPNVNAMVNNMYPGYSRMPPPTSAPNLAAYSGQGLYPGLLSYPYNAFGFPPGLPYLGPPLDQQQLTQLPNIPGLPPAMYPAINPPLSHLVSQAQNVQSQVKESPKNIFSNLNLTGNLTSSGVQQLKDNTKPFSPSITFGQSALSNQSLNSTSTSTTVVSSATVSNASSKNVPVNVVITSSDPLPTFTTSVAQPILSVTIPPQHIKGNVQKPAASQAHNYQIPLAVTNSVTTPAVLSQSAPIVSTQNIMSNVPNPAISVVAKDQTPPRNVALGIKIEKALDETFPSPNKSVDSHGNVSAGSIIEEYDARPDFRPIVPLPDEVPVTTGEEKETELFCQRAKLFRLADVNGTREWKERGVGDIKILFNPETGKVRLLMRREQVHKICANHFLTKEMTLTPMVNNGRAYIWAAHDFADEAIVLEKFCVRFKTSEEANKFAEAFDMAKNKIGQIDNKNKNLPAASISFKPVVQTNSPSNLGGFKFVNTPSFKPNEESVSTPQIEEAEKAVEPNPFASFSFGNKAAGTPAKTTAQPAKFSPLVVSLQNVSKEDEVEEFVPTAEFKPVIDKLPDLVEVKTGEESAEILFDERCKLFRLDTSGDKKEWKERGLGNIKLLKENGLRLVMRRDQVHKVCLNHQVLKTMSFMKNTTDPKAVIWLAQDYSEGVLKPETFTARFKNEDLANKFLKTLQSNQASLDENNQISSKHHKPEASPPKSGFGDKFKAAKGSWECKNCYIINEGKASSCLACETLKSGADPKKAEPTFSFSVKSNNIDSPSPEVTITPVKSGWGNQFKPAAGSWTCKTCYVSNSSDKTKCLSCETPKDGQQPASSSLKSISLDTGGQTFQFGMPQITNSQKQEQNSLNIKTSKPDTATTFSGFGDVFKPQPGSWECKQCLIRNLPGSVHCLSCEAPKDDSVPKKESKGVNLETPGLKFSFGMPASTTSSSSTTSSFSFSLGDPGAGEDTFSWKPAETNVVTATDTKPTEERFVFGSPQKHDFEFKPRSPRRISSGQGDESDASYVEEEEANVYFKPVIPLPDIIEVKTGEENENVLYSHRAKLFRFVDGEWKERGLGDLKILKDTASGKLRVVMRREQILKICLNHWLTKDVEYLPKDEKTWLFHAADFSEGELSRDQFCLRFKSPEVAQAFKKAVDDALGAPETEKPTTENVNKTEELESDSDVEFVSETTVTPEEENEARKLGLPLKFMAYRQRPDCTCNQCRQDDEYLKQLFAKETQPKPFSSVDSGNTSLFGTPTSLATPSSGGSIFSSPAATSFSFATPSSDNKPVLRPPKSETLKDLLQKSSVISKPSTFVAETVNSSTPGSASPLMSATPKESTAFSFGSALQKSTSGTGIFDQKPVENIFKSNIFGTSSPNIFGGGGTFAAAKDDADKNIFAPKPAVDNIFAKNPSADSNIFKSNQDSSNIFGNKSLLTNQNAKSPFSSASNIFSLNPTNKVSAELSNNTGTAAAKNTSIFGGTSSIFGSGSTQTSTAATNLFGSYQGDIFNSNAKPPGNLFGQTIFGQKMEPKVTDANLTFGNTTSNLSESDEVVLKADSNLSFATLAAQSNPKAPPAFVGATKTDEKTPFAFLGAGAPVFGGAKNENKPSQDQLNKTNEGSDNEEVQGDHDPHFEPIVPLPDQIVVSTGEEEETAIFNERAKLFRFDNNIKEWKERGVGQFKILFHPGNKTYRFLLRREQVHKVVLNQRINSDLELQPMSTSDKAWIWAGMNYSEDEAKMEQLAVRFKSSELALAFKKCVDEVIQKATEIQANRSQLSDSIPTTVRDLGVEDVSQGEKLTYEEQEDLEDEDDDDEEDDDEEDERTIMFLKRCTLSEQTKTGWQQICMGDLQVYYDPELYASRISVNNDSGEVVSNTIIGVNTLMEINDKECWWRAVEWADPEELKWRTLKATFSSTAAAQEFHSNYLEGSNYAREVGFIDELPNGEEHDPLE